MKNVLSKKSLVTATVATALLTLFAAAPAQATPAANCAVSASFIGSCLLQPGDTVTGFLKAGNGGPGGAGGNGGSSFTGGFVGGTGGVGAEGGAGAKIPFSYTNTSGSVITLNFSVGSNGAPGPFGFDGINGTIGSPDGTNASNGAPGADGTSTVLEGLNSVALFTANPGTGGTAGTGGTGASTSTNGTDGVNGVAGTAGSGSTVATTSSELPFASITFAGIPVVDPTPTPTPTLAPTLAETGLNYQLESGTGILMGTLIALGSLALILRRRMAPRR
jgi:hypothetical protein